MVSEVSDLDPLYQRPRYQTKAAKQAAAIDDQITALAKAVNDGRVANDARLDAIQQSLEMWRPAVTNLQQQLDELRTQVGRIPLHPALATSSAKPEDAVVRPASSPPPGEPGHHGPSGHGEIVDSGGSAHGVVTTLAPPPVKGAYSPDPLAISPFLTQIWAEKWITDLHSLRIPIGLCLGLISPNSMERTPNFGSLDVRSISMCTGCRRISGSALLLSISPATQRAGCKFGKHTTHRSLGTVSVLLCLPNLVENNIKPSYASLTRCIS